VASRKLPSPFRVSLSVIIASGTGSSGRHEADEPAGAGSSIGKRAPPDPKARGQAQPGEARSWVPRGRPLHSVEEPS
jgi:hypothetical protein